MGWAFAGFGGHPDCTDGSVTVNGSKSCSAAFDPILSVTVTGPGSVSGSGGIAGCRDMSCAGAVTLGSTASLNAAPDPGAMFMGWGGGACAAFMTEPVGFTISSPSDCTATFVVIP
jgi:hypothetical protein